MDLNFLHFLLLIPCRPRHRTRGLSDDVCHEPIFSAVRRTYGDSSNIDFRQHHTVPMLRQRRSIYRILRNETDEY